MFEHNQVDHRYQKACPKPKPIPAAASAMTPQATQASIKSGNTDFISTMPVPPPHCGAHTHKAAVFPDASDYLQGKKLSKKTSAIQAMLEKEKDMIM